MHAAAMHPHIGASFGTEFNPQLYKQSMLALYDAATKLPCFRVCFLLFFKYRSHHFDSWLIMCLVCQRDPRVFFMDANIKDIMSLNPYVLESLSGKKKNADESRERRKSRKDPGVIGERANT